MGLPDGLMPCLSSSADSDLKESIRASNAESQLALPFRTTTVFGASVISSPKGSAVCTEVSAAAGGAAEGLATGAGDAIGAGAGVAVTAGEAEGACASAPPKPSAIAADGISVVMTRRNGGRQFIEFLQSLIQWGRSLERPGSGREGPGRLTRGGRPRPMTDNSWPCVPGRGRRHRITILANPPPLTI